MAERDSHADRPRELAERIAAVKARIARACRESDRPADGVRLVAVSKRHPAALIRSAHALGLRDFGESYAQELRDKQRELADLDDINWHFIGPLQRNKCKYVVGNTALLHSLDSLKLAESVADQARKRSTRQRVLIQVNLAREPQKAGVSPEAFEELLLHVTRAPRLSCCGLMLIPPMAEDARHAAEHFRRLRELLAAWQPRLPQLRELSMGMSSDLEPAIANGATLVRVGTSIFGARER